MQYYDLVRLANTRIIMLSNNAENLATQG